MFDERLEESWRARYGVDPPAGVPPLDRFLAHRCVRAYSSREVPEETVGALVAAAQSAATSSTLQLWSVISVQDPERRERIATLCDVNEHVRTAPWFFCFFADHYRLRQAAEAVGADTQNLDYAEFYTMAVIDAALAAERMVCAAESIGLGICYIGALRNHPQEIGELLELPQGVFGVFGLCVGYPSEPLKAEIKPRLSQDRVWFRETYPPDVSVVDFDERMRSFYERTGMKGDFTWSKRSGRRLSQMTGREVLLGWLRSRGFLQR